MSDNKETSATGLLIGQTCQVEKKKARAGSVIRGYRKGRFILIDSPFQGKESILSVPGESCVIRFLSDGKVFGFTSALLKTYTTPASLCAIQYPEKIESVSVRQSNRIPVFFPGSVSAGSKAPVPGALVDLSANGGCFIVRHLVVSKGESLNLNLLLPDNLNLANMPCLVQSVHATKGKVFMGLKFLFTETEDFEALKIFYTACAYHLL